MVLIKQTILLSYCLIVFVEISQTVLFLKPIASYIAIE